MNRTEQNSEEMLDRIIQDIHGECISDAQAGEAATRVWDRIAKQRNKSGRFATCEDFRSLIPDYITNTLPLGRRLLLEDHARECAACRKILYSEPQPQPVNKLTELPQRRMTRPKWMAIAASATVAVIAGQWAYEQFAPASGGSRMTVQTADGGVYRLQNGVLQPAAVGMELAGDESLRTAAGSRAIVKLPDGSLVEVGERAEFNVSVRRRDTTVHLSRGPIIIQAAKRRTGHLYVSSGDSRVAVTGTVFSVNRGAKGTRVSVVEGEVIVEQGHRDRVLHAGDQLATHRSVETVAIQDEIAWSRNFSEHLKTLQAMANIKEAVQRVRMPGIRYSSRLIDFVPANAVFFLSVPNMRDAITDARALVLTEMKRTGAQIENREVEAFMDRIAGISEYLGEEFVVAGVRSGRDITAIAIADVNRLGLAQFLEAEKVKSSETNVQIAEGPAPVHARQKGELLVSIRENRVVIGVDETLVNAAFSGGSGFGATPFGRRIGDAFRNGTGILLGVDLHSVIRSEATQPDEAAIVTKLGADGLRYLVVEQKTFNNTTQHTADLTFDGARHGLASWLGAPGPMGGLSFVSPNAQFAASVITKNPQEMIEELFALAASKGPDGLAKLEEIQRITGVDIKRDIAASLGSELTVALDGPMLPVPSWKMILEVNQPDHLQQSLEKVVAAMNTEMANRGRANVKITTETEQNRKWYSIQATGEMVLPSIYYTYAEGYMIAGSSKQLVAGAIQSRSSGMRLDTSGQFRGLLPTDQHANFSGIIYQNAQEALRLLSNVATEDQDKIRDIASKVGPTLIGAYADGSRIQVTTFGSSLDLLMQTALAPALHGKHQVVKKRGTLGQTAAYR